MSQSSVTCLRFPFKAFVLLVCAAVVVPLSVTFASVAKAASTDVYVSPTGSDSASGSQTQPFRTVAKGLSAARPGSTVYLRGGVYSERIKNPTIQRGTATAPVTLRNYAGETPVIKGLLWLTNADYWNIKGIDVTWSTSNASNEHMVKMTNGVGWTLEGSELWGAHSFAALLVAGTATNYRVAGNYIHDTYATNNTNQDHLIYVNTRGTGGVIEGNVLRNSPNGRAVKVGPPSADAGKVSDVVIRYNTMEDNTGPSNVQVAWGTSKVSVYRNIMVRPAAKRSAVTAFELTGTGNVVKDNVVWNAVRPVDTGLSGLTDGGGNKMVDPSTVTGYGAAAWNSSSPSPTSSSTPSSSTTPPTSTTTTTPSSTTTTTSTASTTSSTTTTASPTVDGKPSIRSAAQASITTGTSLAVLKPKGTVSGDVLVAGLAVRGAPRVTAPAGWSLVRTQAVSTTMTQLVFSKAAGSSEPTSYTFTLSSPQSAAIDVVALANAKAVKGSSGASGSGTLATAPGETSTHGLQVAFFSVARVSAITPKDPTFGSTVVADGTYDVSLQASQRAASHTPAAMSATVTSSTWAAQTVLVS